MARRRIPDPKIGGSSPSSLIFFTSVGYWSRGMILPLGGRGRRFDSAIAPAFCQCTVAKFVQNLPACFITECLPSSDGRALAF